MGGFDRMWLWSIYVQIIDIYIYNCYCFTVLLTPFIVFRYGMNDCSQGFIDVPRVLRWGC